MVALAGAQIVEVSLAQVAQGVRQVPRDHDWIEAARAVGVHVGQSAPRN
jgi:hypothetical protein